MADTQRYRYTIAVRRDAYEGGTCCEFVADPSWEPMFVTTEFDQRALDALLGTNAIHIQIIKRLAENLVALAENRLEDGDA